MTDRKTVSWANVLLHDCVRRHETQVLYSVRRGWRNLADPCVIVAALAKRLRDSNKLGGCRWLKTTLVDGKRMRMPYLVCVKGPEGGDWTEDWMTERFR